VFSKLPGEKNFERGVKKKKKKGTEAGSEPTDARPRGEIGLKHHPTRILGYNPGKFWVAALTRQKQKKRVDLLRKFRDKKNLVEVKEIGVRRLQHRLGTRRLLWSKKKIKRKKGVVFDRGERECGKKHVGTWGRKASLMRLSEI